MIKKLGMCMMLLVCIAAFEMYDDNRIYGIEPEGDDDYNGEKFDYQDVGPYRPQIHVDPVQSLILYQLFNSIQNRDDTSLRMPYRPKFRMMNNPLTGYGPMPFSEMMEFKDAVAKRRLSAPSSATAAGITSGQQDKPAIPGLDATPIVKPLRKKLPTWICYLKLCNVRFPVRPTSSSG